MTVIDSRELYRRVTALDAGKRDLETYLRALLGLARRCVGEPSSGEIAGMLAAAISAPPVADEPDWPARARDESERVGFAGVERTIVGQIVDLQQMRARGQLADPQRYFGIDAPSGARWYNFDPAGYLECGVRGSVGADDDDPVTLETPPIEIDDEDETRRSFGWDGLTGLLCCGQCYE